MQIKRKKMLSWIQNKLKLMNTVTLEPVGKVKLVKSQQDIYQFLDKAGNANVIIIFKGGKLDQVGGSFGNTKIKKEPLNLDYKDQLQAALAEADKLQKIYTEHVIDNRWNLIAHVLEDL